MSRGRLSGWSVAPAKDGYKLCSRCRIVQPVSGFTRAKQGVDGYKPACRACRKVEAETALQNPKVRERQNAHSRRWYAKHREKARAISRASRRKGYYANIEVARAKGRRDAYRFRRLNPDAWRAIKQRCERRRRAQARGASSSPVNYERICQRDRMVCHICRRKVRRSRLEFDHVIPLARGGAHTETNIAVSHRTCNRQKHVKVVTLF